MFTQIFEDAATTNFLTFENTRAIESAHFGVPRAGRTNDVMKLIFGTQEEAQDYVVGLLVASIAVFIFFLSWIAILITLQLLGPKRVGFFSGRRYPLPPRPNEDLHLKEEEEPVKEEQEKEEGSPDTVRAERAEVDADDDVPASKQDTTPPSTSSSPHRMTVDEWDALYKKKVKQQRYMKVIVFLAACTVIAMAIVMAIKGVQSLRGSLTYGKTSINYAQEIVDRVDNLIGNLLLLLTSFQRDMSKLLNVTNTICPSVRPLLCNDIYNASTCNTEGILPEGVLEDLITTFNTDWTFVDRLQETRVDLHSISTTAEGVSDTISTFDWVFYVAVLFDLLVALLALTMIVQLVFGSKLPWAVRCLCHRFLFPTFLIFVIFSFIFAIAFLIASLALSDTCVDNPDARKYNFLFWGRVKLWTQYINSLPNSLPSLSFLSKPPSPFTYLFANNRHPTNCRIFFERIPSIYIPTSVFLVKSMQCPTTIDQCR
jgi:hypothetical protein